MKKLKRIGLLVDASRAYGRGVCRGVADFADTRADWLILPHERPELRELPDWIEGARLDGLIAYIPNQRLYRKIASLGIPAVDVHGRCRGGSIPVIESEAGRIVSLALEFFGRAGFRHFAFCGYPGIFFSDQREAAFQAHAGKVGGDVHLYAPKQSRQPGQDLYEFEKGRPADVRELMVWLSHLPKPVAVLACNDIRGQQVINACREKNLAIPEQVAVLGIDNDEIICRLSRPTLSSIEPDVEMVGFLAASLIASRLAGSPVARRHRLPPRQIVERQSTDTVVADAPEVVAAARLIRSRIGISVDQVCEQTGVSRSKLDRLFASAIGRTVAGEMTRVKLQLSQNLLVNSALPVAEIARHCGFCSATYFCRFFKRETGRTPEAFRRQEQSPTGRLFSLAGSGISA